MKQIRVRAWFYLSLMPPLVFGLIGANYNNKLGWFLSGLSTAPPLWLIGRRLSAWLFPVGQLGPASPSPSRHGRLGYRGQMRRVRAR
jgi:hypothetical protein